MKNHSNKSTEESSVFLPEIRRARFDKLTIYEISESELDILEKGSPSSTYLDFAIGLLSAAIAFSITLASTDINSTKIFSVFVISVILGYLFGLVFLILWWKNYTSVSGVVNIIRNRLPPEGTSEITAVNDTLVIVQSISVEENQIINKPEV